MKKIISLILVLSFIFTYPIFSQAEEVTSSDISLPSASGLLNTLEIMDITEDNLSQALTRQEFAKILFKLIVNSDLYTEDYTVSVYPDVTDEEYIGYVNEMVRLKVITGYSDGTFRPESEITLAEAVTFIIRAIGYDMKAEANGGYPTGYLQEAQKAGLLKGVSISSGDTLTNAECAVLIKNTLMAKLQQKDGFSSDGSVSYVDTEYTLLNSVHRIEVIKDVVNGIDLTKLFGESTVKPWHILIGTKELDIGKLEPKEFLGMYVEAYYSLDDDTLIYIEKSKRNNIEVIDIKDLYSINNSSNIITKEGYYENTEYKYNILTSFIYNYGISNAPFTVEMFNGKQGTLTLIDNNADMVYDVVKADVYYDIVCDYIDTSSKYIYDALTGNPYFADCELQNPFINIYDLDGKTVDIKDIKKYNVLSIYETLPEHEQKCVNMILSTSVVNGSASEVKYDDYGRLVAVIKGNEYIFTESAMNYLGTGLEIGKNYIFYLNSEGYIAGMNNNATELMSFGMITHYYVEETPMDRTIRLFYMNQEGKRQETGLKKWVTIDNIKYRNNDANLLKHLDKTSDIDFGVSAKCNGTQVIKYQLDEEGNIAFIDTIASSYDIMTDTAIAADEDSECDTYNCLRRGVSTAESANEPTFYWNAQCYDGQVFIGTKTLAFSGPYRNLSDSSVYRDTDSYGKATAGKQWYYTSYYDDPESYHASLIFYHRVASDNSVSGHYKIVSVFDKYTRAVNSDGELGYKIYYWEGSSYKSKFALSNVGWYDSGNKLGNGKVKITPEMLKQGDVLRFSENSDGSIVSYYVCYRAEGDIFISQVDLENIFSGEAILSGFLYRKYNDGASYAKETDISNVSDDSKILYFGTDVPVIVYNPNEPLKRRVQVDTHNSGEYYKISGSNASRVMVTLENAKPLAVYIIKR